MDYLPTIFEIVGVKMPDSRPLEGESPIADDKMENRCP
jgi:hypothetical protein